MSPISHKKAGLALLPFMNDDVYFELNSDLIHVNEHIVRMCYNCLNHDRLILITDAVVSAGAEYGTYAYFGKEVKSDESGVRYTENGTLIGSNCLIPEVAKRFMRVTGAPVHEVVKFMSINPCRLLGIDEKRGSVEIGKEADLVIMDEEFNIKKNLAEL
jgi:N-acetylglucosamine-6-phosphate deacetylase